MPVKIAVRAGANSNRFQLPKCLLENLISLHTYINNTTKVWMLRCLDICYLYAKITERIALNFSYSSPGLTHALLSIPGISSHDIKVL